MGFCYLKALKIYFFPLGLSSGCYNKAPYQQHKCVSHSSGSWKSQIMVPAWSGSGKSLLPGVQLAVIHGLLTWWRTERGRKLSCLFIYGRYSYSWGLHPPYLITSQRSHLQILSHCELAFNIQTGGGERRVGTNIQSLTGASRQRVFPIPLNPTCLDCF